MKRKSLVCVLLFCTFLSVICIFAVNAEAGVRVYFSDHDSRHDRDYYRHDRDHWPFDPPRTRTIYVPVVVEPSAPERFYVNPKEFGNELNWSKAHGNDYGYFILRSDNDGKTYAMIQFVGSEVTSYIDTNVIGGVTYYYLIQNAYRDGTGGGRSKIVAARAFYTSQPPIVIVQKATSSDAVQVPVVTQVESDSTGAVASYKMTKSSKGLKAPAKIAAKFSGNSVSIIWSASKNADGYEIFKTSEDPVGSFQKIGEIKGSTSFEDRSVDKTKQYFYYVVAFDKNGTSPKSKIASAVDAQ